MGHVLVSGSFLTHQNRLVLVSYRLVGWHLPVVMLLGLGSRLDQSVVMNRQLGLILPVVMIQQQRMVLISVMFLESAKIR